MTPRRLLVAVVAGLWWAVASHLAHAQPGVERITAYDVDMVVEATGSMVVTEVIDYDFAGLERHGILRHIPVRLRYDGRYDRVYPVDVLSVDASPGTPDEYEEEDSGNARRLRIGDPDTTISGAHRYTIRYRVDAALNGFEDHDELYWNAVGPEWDVPIERVTARVRVPSPDRKSVV